MGKQNKVFGIPRWGLLKGDAAELIMMLDLVPSGTVAGEPSTLSSLKESDVPHVFMRAEGKSAERDTKRDGERERERNTALSEFIMM